MAKELFYDVYGFNTWLFKLINSFHTASYDAFMLYVTKLGDHRFFLPYLMVLGVYALLSIIWRKLRGKGAVKQHFVMWLGVFAVLGAAAVVNYAVLDMLKHYFEYSRPYMVLSREQIFVIEPLEAEKATQSFPSGHVAFITMMVIGLWPVLSHHMRLFGLFVIALVAWSRVAVGVHFPMDTVGAFLISGAVVLCVRLLLYTLFRKLFGLNCGGA